ncbi:hypothetical protein BXT86_02285 [candidate division WOR-3 bacterium 4484_100]|uniref:CNNM transmembrane domain-containing protein n=1 Tax=candidate division WOR-3 bacterium 4484_100 TaxID=1936077 RepID=A0A1V4QGV4_UNCW3|nr:MAG: hypothetical protein BXT86_02285 [candidate division WOR-3 bacterium 4484_100]
MIIFLIIPLILILCQGIFTASETGLVSIERIKVMRAKRQRKKWAVIINNFLNRPEQFFSTILVSENFILVIASTLFAHFFIENFGGSGVVISTITLSVFSLFFGQFIPKSIALSQPYATMNILAPIIYYIEIALYPIVYLYAGLANIISSVFVREKKVVSIRRLDIVYAMSEYEKEASTLASRLFEFSRRRISEVMIPIRAAFVCKLGNESVCVKKPGRRLYTRIPVYKGRRSNIVGIFNIKDYFYTNKVKLRKPLFVSGDERCMTIFKIMKAQGEHMAVVKNKKGQVIGIVTLEDLFEELVGEIRDER